MNELVPASYECASCGERNETSVDPSGGYLQTYTEDCTICCRPNVLHVSIFPEGEVVVQATFEE